MSAVATDELQVQLLHPAACPPARTRAGGRRFDLRCVEGFSLAPGERAVVGTASRGVAGGDVRARGAALGPRRAARDLGGQRPGPDRPELPRRDPRRLVNLGAEPYAGEPGDRIAQLLLVPFAAPDTRVVDELPASADDRGANGFGSSGR